MKRIILFALIAFALCLGTAYASPDDHGDDCDFATKVNLNSSVNGRLNTNDYDFFSVEVTSSGYLTAYTTGSTDTYGYLTDVNGCWQEIALTEDDDSASDENFMIDSYPVSAGTYYIIIKGFVPATIGDYRLYVNWSRKSGGGSGGGQTQNLSVDVFTNKGGAGQNVNGGSFSLGESMTVSVSLNKSATYDIDIRESNGSLRYSDRYQGSAGTQVVLSGHASQPAGTRTITVSAWTGNEWAQDTCLYQVVSGQSGQLLSVDVYTNKGGQGAHAYGGNYGHYEMLSIYLQLNKSSTYDLEVRDVGGNLRYQDSKYVGAGTRHIVSDYTSNYDGRRIITVNAWTGTGEYAADTCTYDVGQDVAFAIPDTQTDDEGRGSGAVTGSADDQATTGAPPKDQTATGDGEGWGIRKR